jgi:excisionase family DNA binding protein
MTAPRKTASPVAAVTKNNLTPVVSSSVPTSAPVILTVAEVAAYLKVPVSSVYEKTRFRGHNRRPLPARRVGRYLRFVQSEVQDYLLSLPLESRQAKRSYRKRNAASQQDNAAQVAK